MEEEGEEEEEEEEEEEDDDDDDDDDDFGCLFVLAYIVYPHYPYIWSLLTL